MGQCRKIIMTVDSTSHNEIGNRSICLTNYSTRTRQSRLQLALELLNSYSGGASGGRSKLPHLTEGQYDEIMRNKPEDALRFSSYYSLEPSRIQTLTSSYISLNDDKLKEPRKALRLINGAFANQDIELLRAFMLAENFNDVKNNDTGVPVGCYLKSSDIKNAKCEFVGNNYWKYYDVMADQWNFYYKDAKINAATHMQKMKAKRAKDARSLNQFELGVLQAENQLANPNFNRDDAIMALKIEVSALLILNSTSWATRFFHFNKYTYMQIIFDNLKRSTDINIKGQFFRALLHCANCPRENCSSSTAEKNKFTTLMADIHKGKIIGFNLNLRTRTVRNIERLNTLPGFFHPKADQTVNPTAESGLPSYSSIFPA